MGAINRTASLAVVYDGVTYSSDEATETGDIEIRIAETVPASNTIDFPAGMTAGDEQLIVISSSEPNVTITTNGGAGDSLMTAANNGVYMWSKSSGVASPIASAITDIRVVNNSSTNAAVVTVFVLHES